MISSSCNGGRNWTEGRWSFFFFRESQCPGANQRIFEFCLHCKSSSYLCLYLRHDATVAKIEAILDSIIFHPTPWNDKKQIFLEVDIDFKQ